MYFFREIVKTKNEMNFGHFNKTEFIAENKFELNIHFSRLLGKRIVELVIETTLKVTLIFTFFYHSFRYT